MYDCFRPGDIVLADVLSLGDARSYFLSTAKNELGVVHAKSLAGGRGRGRCRLPLLQGTGATAFCLAPAPGPAAHRPA
jgi:exosome complex RNA-binding protein Csl4